MATFKIVVLPHQIRKSDQKYPVSIRITWKRGSAYLSTHLYVSKSQLDPQLLKLKKYIIIDKHTLIELNKRISKYEELKAKELGQNIEEYSAQDLVEYFEGSFKREQMKKINPKTKINLFKFSEDLIHKIGEKSGNGKIYTTVINSLKKYLRRDYLMLSEINLDFIQKYEEWLRTERYEKNKLIEPLTNSGINLYQRTFKALFNKCIKLHINEIIEHGVDQVSPFEYYTLPQIPIVEKRALTPDQIKNILSYEPTQHRDKLAKDVFILSLCLLGTNSVDFYNCEEFKNGRLSYKRTKTKNRRKDEAFISIKVENEILPLINQYRDPSKKRIFKFYQMYSNHENFNKAVNKGLKIIGKNPSINIPKLTYYSARHSFATICINKLKSDKYTIHTALNHVSDKDMKITDYYVEYDHSLVDEENRKFIDYIFNL